MDSFLVRVVAVLLFVAAMAAVVSAVFDSGRVFSALGLGDPSGSVEGSDFAAKAANRGELMKVEGPRGWSGGVAASSCYYGTGSCSAQVSREFVAPVSVSMGQACEQAGAWAGGVLSAQALESCVARVSAAVPVAAGRGVDTALAAGVAVPVPVAAGVPSNVSRAALAPDGRGRMVLVVSAGV